MKKENKQLLSDEIEIYRICCNKKTVPLAVIKKLHQKLKDMENNLINKIK